MSIKVAIVEDHPLVRETLAALIDATPNLVCVAAYTSAEEALASLGGRDPGVVLMDINLPGMSGIDCVELLRQSLPDSQIIMLTIEEDTEQVFESLKAGAMGYLVKHASAEEILEAIVEVNRGGAPMSSTIARKVVTAFRQPCSGDDSLLSLSAREQEVLAFLARGDRSKEIAERLGIGIGTVNTYVRNIYEKLQVRSRAEAVARFLAREDVARPGA